MSVMEKQCVFCKARTDLLKIKWANFMSEGAGLSFQKPKNFPYQRTLTHLLSTFLTKIFDHFQCLNLDGIVQYQPLFTHLSAN
jgi:hypothetical protein